MSLTIFQNSAKCGIIFYSIAQLLQSFNQLWIIGNIKNWWNVKFLKKWCCTDIILVVSTLSRKWFPNQHLTYTYYNTKLQWRKWNLVHLLDVLEMSVGWLSHYGFTRDGLGLEWGDGNYTPFSAMESKKPISSVNMFESCYRILMCIRTKLLLVWCLPHHYVSGHCNSFSLWG